jgi:hypothetical protein
MARKDARIAELEKEADHQPCFFEEKYYALTAERDALAADAARYRWLREQPSHRTSNPDEDELVRTICVDSWKGSLGKQMSGEKCDAAIDAALEGTK